MTTVLESLNGALHGLMAEDPRVVIVGEDILDPYGGAFKVTRGLSSKHPDRVYTTPISEAAIVGLGSGMALRGLRPIVEIMFGDFLFLASDQIVNHAAKFRWMYNDAVRVPLVIRTPMGGRRGYGPTHSQSLEKHFMGVPGLWMVAPSVLTQPGDLLKQATLDCDDPVIFVESKTCYGRELVSAVPGTTSQTIVAGDAPFPTRHLRHDGVGQPDAVLWCYGGMVPHALEAILRLRDEEGLHVDLAAVSQLSPLPVSHIARILASVSSGVHVYAEEASVRHGWSAEMVAEVDAQLSDGGRVQHVRVGAAHTPIPSGRELERRTLPQVDELVARVIECF
jgi:pyruvate/2-oxoglutarate/acetoin dehydrogenase E1 component